MGTSAVRFEPPVQEVIEFFPRRARHCLCVITWNEGRRLRGELERLRFIADAIDIIVADGQSTDGSTDPAFLESMGVRARLSTAERGLSAATRMALAYAMEAGYEGVMTVDGNGKDGVEAAPAFVRALESGFDLVQGSRFMKGGLHRNTPLLRIFGIRWVLAPLIALGGGFHYTDPTNGFRGMSRRFLIDPRVQPIRREFVRFNLQHYLIWRAARLKFKVGEIPVSRIYPEEGPVPTKIHGIGANLAVLGELLNVLMGRLNP